MQVPAHRRQQGALLRRKAQGGLPPFACAYISTSPVNRPLRLEASVCLTRPLVVVCVQVRVLPTLVLFTDGVALDHVQGFEAFTQGLPEGKQDEFPTNRVRHTLKD